MEDFIKDELSQISNKLGVDSHQNTNDKSQINRNLESLDIVNKKTKEVKREYDSRLIIDNSVFLSASIILHISWLCKILLQVK